MNETIAAISTALSNSAISIVRLSGEEAISIVNKSFKGKDLSKAKSHTINYGYIVDENKEIVDEVLVSIFIAPKTFTRENVVEINCHGGIYVTNKILEIMLNNGAYLASPGEFTKRAYINGRIDLTQAEAVMDMIEASTKQSLKLASYGLKGEIKKLIEGFRKKLLTCISKIEVNIDYPEYETEEIITNEILKPTIKELIKELNIILNKSETSMAIKEGIDTAIIGRPNVGKSSLLNALLNEEKAIVTEVAGTTRDIIEGKINIGGIVLNLIDTAGIRNTKNIVEKIGVEKTKKVLEEANLVILVFDYHNQLDDEDMKLLELTKEKNKIIVINKEDLPKRIELEKFDDYVLLSSLNKTNLEKLKEKINKVCQISDVTNIDATYIGNARQISKIKQAYNSLNDALNGIEEMLPIDIINIDINSAWISLGEILGEVSSDDLINELFSKFCLGK